MATLLSMDNPVFRAFAFYAAASLVKMVALAFLTSKSRIINKVRVCQFSNRYIVW